MEILTTSLTHLPEIVTAVIMVLGSQKGVELYKKKRFSNGRHDRRSSQGNNSFCQSDKDFIEGCFKNQTKSTVSALETNHLKLVVDLGDIIRKEGESTRIAVRSN